jgi:hypothetical protein
MLWLGGMFFLGVVGVPVLRGIEPASLRQSVEYHLRELPHVYADFVYIRSEN